MDLGPRLGDQQHDCLKAGIARSLSGTALEFGVGAGTSARLLATRFDRVVGFDSFQGLPEDWRPGFPKGTFACERPKVARLELVEGLFERTIAPWVMENLDAMRWVSLVHIDCDLYSSTKTVLEAIGPYLRPWTLLVFDEFHGYEGAEQHEQRAWLEYTATHGLKFLILGHGPEQVLIQARRLR